jgi:hypothetical protein
MAIIKAGNFTLCDVSLKRAHSTNLGELESDASSTAIKFGQFTNALQAIDAAELGISMTSRDRQSLKAQFSIRCNLESSSNSTTLKLEQHANPLVQIISTEAGITMEIKDEQSIKAHMPILLSLDPG